MGCSPWGREESDTTELHFHFPLSCIGEGNGNPLQCSCLENPRDRGAWWAAIYGVAQSWARLKRLSSSSSIHALIIETDAFKNIVSFNPTVELEEVIIVPILQPKKLWFGGKIRPDTKQISEANLNLKSFHSIACMLNHFSYVLFFAILWTIACQGPLSMGFSRQ